MSTPERRDFDVELDQFAKDIEQLQSSLIRLALDLADGQNPYFLSRAVTGAYHLDRARTVLERPPRGTSSGGTTGQTDPISSQGGGLRA